MYGKAPTSDIQGFLDSKGLARVSGEPYSFCDYGDGKGTVVSLDEEYSWVDLNHLGEDWARDGAQELFAELLEFFGVRKTGS